MEKRGLLNSFGLRPGKQQPDGRERMRPGKSVYLKAPSGKKGTTHPGEWPRASNGRAKVEGWTMDLVIQKGGNQLKRLLMQKKNSHDWGWSFVGMIRKKNNYVTDRGAKKNRSAYLEGGEREGYVGTKRRWVLGICLESKG